ncbi:MAG: MBOAT family O-acyltransferase [Gammaproteobacteria bacterium]
MIFNSHAFIFGFLPVTLVIYYVLGQLPSRRPALIWLTGASFFFYGWWNPSYLLLLLGSILFNFYVGLLLVRAASRGSVLRRLVLSLGIIGNLALLGYYKYSGFFISNLDALSGFDFQIQAVVLPLGISFYTFTQLAYLVDASRGEAEEYDLISYCLFVTFFPHLIAGPIIHHRQVMPQFARPGTFRFSHSNLAVGSTFFAIGLFKKVVWADTLATFASPVFDAAAGGAQMSAFDAWSGVLAYTLQLYFDFSGYSDMAVGLSRMLGIYLPYNFNSPYKAVNIIDFWRRWHMTLSRFLRDYLYIPLGGNRSGKVRRYVNLFVTVLLGGLWHGAGWTFVFWGALHGFYLIVNHAWQALRTHLRFPGGGTPWGRALARLLTLMAVIIGWVFFRAESVEAALNLLSAMGGTHGLLVAAAPEQLAALLTGWTGVGEALRQILPYLDRSVFIASLLAFVVFAPNTQEWIDQSDLGRMAWRPSPLWASVTAAMLLFCVSQLSKVSPFLYFQF